MCLKTTPVDVASIMRNPQWLTLHHVPGSMQGFGRRFFRAHSLVGLTRFSMIAEGRCSIYVMALIHIFEAGMETLNIF